MAAPGNAEAAGGRAIGVFDGNWNVVFATRQGTCSAATSSSFTVSGGRVYSNGSGKVSGGVNANGAVSVRVSVGMSAANGTGRLSRNAGAGQWNGVISGDQCSGIWQATRM